MNQWKKDGRFYLTLSFLVMAVLFYSSSQTYQQQSQIGLLKSLLANEPFKDKMTSLSFLYAGNEVSIASNGYFSFVEFFIRKGAHFTTYLIMSWGLFNGLLPRMKTWFLTGIIAWLAATGYAGLDEFHQMLTGGRSPLIQDVMLDSAGALTAIALCWLWIFWKKRK